jgi:RNA polymerase sigma-70 factor (ECF subfamily)
MGRSEQAEDIDSARLVAAAQAGDREAFGMLYARYFDRVYGVLRLLLRNRHDAEEVAQHVFMKAMEDIGGYRPMPGKPFRSWLFTVAYHAGVSRLRERDRYELAETNEIDRRRDCAYEDEPPAFDWITDSELSLFVERLPLVQRQVLVLRYLLDLSAEDTAKILNRSIGDVRSLQSRAIRFLRNRLTSIRESQAEIAPGARETDMRGTVRQSYVLRGRRFILGGLN